MSLEAAAGKNPVNHTGKLYSLLAERIARALAETLPEVDEAYCHLLSRIGSPVTEPQLADIGLRLAEAATIDAVRGGAAQVVRAQLRTAAELWHDVLAGRCPVC
jgi:S-adenosylmethionine synthetase